MSDPVLVANVIGLQTALDAKQATLVSGTNIKTVNGSPILGEGDLTVSGGVTNTTTSGVLAADATVTITHPADASFLREVTFLRANSTAKLLLNGNGTNGATTFTDSSVFANTVTVLGSGTTTSTAQSKFGGASINCNGSGGLAVAYNSALAISGNDWCIEAWIRISSLATNRGVIFIGASDTSRLQITITTTGASSCYIEHTDGTTMNLASSTVTMVTNTWYHIAFTKSGTGFTYYIDGVLQNSAISSVVLPVSQPIQIGKTRTGGSTQYFSGYIDDFRLTIGDAVYTSGFTPPAAELSYASIYSPSALVDSLSLTGVFAEYLTSTTTRFTNKLGSIAAYKAIVRTY